MSSPTGPTLFSPGDVLGRRYRVLRLVGRGGTGEVYEGEDLARGGKVALKTVLPELLGSTKVAARFEREIELSQRISHPNVLRIFELLKVPLPKHAARGGPVPTAPCMVMEFLAGETLADYLGRGKTFTPEAAKPLVCQMAAALAAAHRAHVVHRDLKPDNMFLVLGEDGPRVVITDFGVARYNAPRQDESLTASNVLLGTPSYMAPEQLELEEAIPASDIYTLGLVMFEMIVGRPAFEAETAIKMVFKRVQEDPPSPRQFLPDLDPRWEEVILRCLHRDPTARYADAADIIRVLDGDRSPYLTAGRSLGRGTRLLRLAAAFLLTAALAAVAVYLFLL